MAASIASVTARRALTRPATHLIHSQAQCCFRSQVAPTTRRPWRGAETRRGFSASAHAQEKYYTEDHEWIELSPDRKTGKIGVSTYAAQQLGDVVYVELPALQHEFKAGDAIGAVESVKSASDILTPVSGKVVEVNEALAEKPGLINKSPEGEAWIATIEVADEAEVETLIDGEAYKKLTEG